VRRSIDWWLTHRVRETGESCLLLGLRQLSARQCRALIAAWDYVEVSQDVAWLQRRIERLEFVAEFLARRRHGR